MALCWWYLQILFIIVLISGAESAVFTLENNCTNTIWPGIQPEDGKPQLVNDLFQLNPGQSMNINATEGWEGMVWGRSGCTFDQSGMGNCLTGDVPPASLAMFILDSSLDFYGINLIDGYNMPISISPSGGVESYGCQTVSCLPDLNQHCPQNLQVRKNGGIVACNSACTAFNKPEYCCTGVYDSSQACKPSNYTEYFKASCPMTATYAYDDQTNIFTCKGANYVIRFC